MRYMGYWDRKFREFLARELGPECAYPDLARLSVEQVIKDETEA